MDSTSRIYISPTFNRDSSNDIADIADRVVQELRAANGFKNDDVFSFSDDDTPADVTGDGEVSACNNRTETEEDEHEFEFPVVCSDSNPVSTDEVVSVSGDQISLRYPLFDRSLLSETDGGVDTPATDSKPAPATRPSLRKLLSEDRDAPSTSSSETDGLDGITPGTYCVWKPNTEAPRGKHKKSNSVSVNDNISRRWKVRDLLKRSYSDDNYSTGGKEPPVVLFIPPIPPKPKTNDEKEKVNKTEKSGKVGGIVAATKPERNIPAYRKKIGNIRIPPHLPYRQDQVAAFGNIKGSTTNLYRY